MPDSNVPVPAPAPTAPSLPWYARLGLKVFGGKLRSAAGTFFSGRPGLFRTILALYILAMIVLPMVHLDDPAQLVAWLIQTLGLAGAAAGVPVDQKALADAVNHFVEALLALIALLRPLVRWVMAGFAKKAA